MNDAKELVEAAVGHLGFPFLAAWRPSSTSKERVFSWEYADLDFGESEKLTVGASSGGVVSINGDSFAPDTRKPNVTLVNVVRSLSAAIASMYPIFSAHEQFSSERVRVYKIANTYSAASQYRLLQEQGLSAEWDNRMIDGETQFGITLPKRELSLLRLLQADYPERWGTPPTDDQQSEAEVDSELILFRSMEVDAYVALMPNGHVAITDGYSTDYVNIRGIGDWSRDSDQLSIAQDIRNFLSSLDSVEAAAKAQERTGYVVLSIDNTDNAAFVDVGRDQEISRIIKDAAASIELATLRSDMDFSLRDINGNRVGKVELTNAVPSGKLNIGAMLLFIKTGNAAFDGDAPHEVASILREAAGRVGNGEHLFALRDAYGNTVGKLEFREEPSLEKDGVIDMTEALDSGRVYWADDGFFSIAHGEYHFVVTTPDFEPGHGIAEVWLVNAKGETAPGYDDPQPVHETDFRELKTAEESDLRAVVEGRITFDDYERNFSGDEPELG